MKCMLFLAVLSVFALVHAGKVTIKGSCIDCNEPSTTPRQASKDKHNTASRHETTVKPAKAAPAAGHAVKHGNADDDDDDDDSSAQGSWSLQQWDSAEGVLQQIRRHNRQLYTSGGYVIDASRYPGTVLHNKDCVGCNIRGG